MSFSLKILEIIGIDDDCFVVKIKWIKFRIQLRINATWRWADHGAGKKSGAWEFRQTPNDDNVTAVGVALFKVEVRTLFKSHLKLSKDVKLTSINSFAMIRLIAYTSDRVHRRSSSSPKTYACLLCFCLMHFKSHHRVQDEDLSELTVDAFQKRISLNITVGVFTASLVSTSISVSIVSACLVNHRSPYVAKLVNQYNYITLKHFFLSNHVLDLLVPVIMQFQTRLYDHVLNRGGVQINTSKNKWNKEIHGEAVHCQVFKMLLCIVSAVWSCCFEQESNGNSVRFRSRLTELYRRK